MRSPTRMISELRRLEKSSNSLYSWRLSVPSSPLRLQGTVRRGLRRESEMHRFGSLSGGRGGPLALLVAAVRLSLRRPLGFLHRRRSAGAARAENGRRRRRSTPPLGAQTRELVQPAMWVMVKGVCSISIAHDLSRGESEGSAISSRRADRRDSRQACRQERRPSGAGRTRRAYRRGRRPSGAGHSRQAYHLARQVRHRDTHTSRQGVAPGAPPIGG